MKDLAAALARLDPENRALLELSVRLGLPDGELAELMGAPADEVRRRRSELIDRLAAELGLESREQRDELRATLPDLPERLWKSG
jgi:DNA-directed RNA polymerase specialized sigma24 family protein